MCNVIKFLPLVQWQYFDNNKRLTYHKNGDGKAFEVFRQEKKYFIEILDSGKIRVTDYLQDNPVLLKLNKKSAKIIKIRRKKERE